MEAGTFMSHKNPHFPFNRSVNSVLTEEKSGRKMIIENYGQNDGQICWLFVYNLLSHIICVGLQKIKSRNWNVAIKGSQPPPHLTPSKQAPFQNLTFLLPAIWSLINGFWLKLSFRPSLVSNIEEVLEISGFPFCQLTFGQNSTTTPQFFWRRKVSQAWKGSANG